MTKILKSFLLTIFAYLVQVSIMPRLPIFTVSANILIICQAIIIVAYGRQHGISVSLIMGIIMESMIPMLEYFNLLVYPVIGALGLITFADKTDRRLEMERNLNKKNAGNRDPLFRTILCTMFISLIFEILNLIYFMLKGVVLDTEHISRIFIAILYNATVCIIIVVPVRKFLGFNFVLPSKLRRNKVQTIKDIDPGLGKAPIKYNYTTGDYIVPNINNNSFTETEKTDVITKDSKNFPELDIQRDDYKIDDNDDISPETEVKKQDGISGD